MSIPVQFNIVDYPFFAPSQNLAAAFSSPNTAGNLLVAAAIAIEGGTPDFSISDTAGNTWSAPIPFGPNGFGVGAFFICANAKAGPNTVTIVDGTVVTAARSVVVAEYAGKSAAFDVSATPFGASSSTPNISLTTTKAPDYVCGFFSSGATVGTPSAPFFGTYEGAGTFNSGYFMDASLSATGSQTLGFTDTSGPFNYFAMGIAITYTPLSKGDSCPKSWGNPFSFGG